MQHTLQPVQSSTIAGYRFDGTNLYIGFVKGDVYRYLLVPQDVVDRFEKASSKGKEFSASIKNTYPFDRLVGDTFITAIATPFKKTTHLSIIDVAVRYPFLLAF